MKEQKMTSDLAGLGKREVEASSNIEHPSHYGGEDNLYETIKVIEAWGLGFNLGNAVKYISRAGKKTSSPLEDLEKSLFYLKREVQSIKSRH